MVKFDITLSVTIRIFKWVITLGVDHVVPTV
jgi:hypothetical protein